MKKGQRVKLKAEAELGSGAVVPKGTIGTCDNSRTCRVKLDNPIPIPHESRFRGFHEEVIIGHQSWDVIEDPLLPEPEKPRRAIKRRM